MVTQTCAVDVSSAVFFTRYCGSLDLHSAVTGRNVTGSPAEEPTFLLFSPTAVVSPRSPSEMALLSIKFLCKQARLSHQGM